MILVLIWASARWLTPAGRDTNFSQYPGFDAYVAAHPPLDSLPDQLEQALLRKHAPRFFVADGEEGPIGFYQDYIAQGRLEAAGKTLRKVTREILNAYKDDPHAVFTHEPEAVTPTPVVLGRIDRTEKFTVLTYHAVFRKSGLPAGLSRWQWLLAALLGDPRDWHQLDHYTAAFLFLDSRMLPAALMVQQHNYQRSYLFGETVTLPADGRVMIDVAIGSNELYPHQPGRRGRRAVSFLTPAMLRYMLDGERKPWQVADDVTDPSREVAYRLEFLPPSDAFYTFKGFLGERRALPGRDGPPGAQYNTLPALKPLETQLALGYWRDGNINDLNRLPETEDNRAYLAFAEAQREAMLANMACLATRMTNCVLK
jgi:hypothetical protein